MGTLTIALAAALLAGNVPERVSGETRQSLDLRGEWRGVWHCGGECLPAAIERFPDGRYIVGRKGGTTVRLSLAKIADKGDGRLWIGRSILGAYRQQPGQVSICYCPAENAYPTSFRSGTEQDLIVLHRARRGK